MSCFYLKNTKGSEYYEYNQKHHTHRSNFSDDEQHRYLLKRLGIKQTRMYSDNDVSSFRWRIITRSYNSLILNQLANSEQYGVYLVNLFSNIKTPENLKHIKEPYDKHTDIHLMKAISESDTVILAYGAYAKPVVVERVKQVMEMLKPHKRKSKSSLIQPQ